MTSTAAEKTAVAARYLAASDAKLIADARAMADCFTNAKRREFLTSIGSDYADHADDGIADGAFLGWALSTAQDLAKRLEHELTRGGDDMHLMVSVARPATRIDVPGRRDEDA